MQQVEGREASESEDEPEAAAPRGEAVVMDEAILDGAQIVSTSDAQPQAGISKPTENNLCHMLNRAFRVERMMAAVSNSLLLRGVYQAYTWSTRIGSWKFCRNLALLWVKVAVAYVDWDGNVSVLFVSASVMATAVVSRIDELHQPLMPSMPSLHILRPVWHEAFSLRTWVQTRGLIKTLEMLPGLPSPAYMRC